MAAGTCDKTCLNKSATENWIGNFHGDFLEVTARERNKQIGGNIKNPKKHICERNKQIGRLFFHHYSVKLLIFFFFSYSLNIWKKGLLKMPSQNVPLESFLVKNTSVGKSVKIPVKFYWNQVMFHLHIFLLATKVVRESDCRRIQRGLKTAKKWKKSKMKFCLKGLVTKNTKRITNQKSEGVAL